MVSAVIRVFIAEDHTLVRKGLVRLIGDAADMNVVGECEDGTTVLNFANDYIWDVLVLDIGLPDINGIQILAELAALGAKGRTLVVSGYPEEQYAVRALRAGAAGYLTKNMAPEQMLMAIRRIFSGGRYITPDIAERVLDQIDGKSEPENILSKREYDVFIAIAKGTSTQAIAKRFKISVSSVHTYRRRIRGKLGLQTDTDFVRLAIKLGAID